VRENRPAVGGGNANDPFGVNRTPLGT